MGSDKRNVKHDTEYLRVKRNSQLARAATAVTLALLISACGGGGSDEESAADAAAPPPVADNPPPPVADTPTDPPPPIDDGIPPPVAGDCSTPPAGKADAWPEHPVDQWVKVAPVDGRTPGVRWEAGGAYDALTDTWFHHGGHDRIPQSPHLFSYSLSADDWQWQMPEDVPAGACNIDGALKFNHANRKVVRFPGDTLGHGFQFSRGVKLKNSAVWQFDPDAGTWTNMRPAPYTKGARYDSGNLSYSNAAAAIDTRRGLVYHFGGKNNAGHTNTLRYYDASANEMNVIELGNRPPIRSGAGFAYNQKNDVLVMFGAQFIEDPIVYSWQPGDQNWTSHAIEPHPEVTVVEPYSTLPRMACAEHSDSCLAVIWREDATEAWLLNTTAWTWTRIATVNQPSLSRSRSRNVAYSPSRGVYLLSMQTVDDQVELWSLRPSALPTPPTAAETPQGLNVKAQPDGWQLEWFAAPGADKYRIYRVEGNSPLSHKTLLAESTCPSFKDSSNSVNTKYYEVRAVDTEGVETPLGAVADSIPAVETVPVVSVLATDLVTIEWNAHSADDVVGYNLYRGVVHVDSVLEGEPGKWQDNDPRYDQHQVVGVDDITDIEQLNGVPLTSTYFEDTDLDLSQAPAASGDYRFAVYAYIVRAVDARGVESGGSPYALTIPRAPRAFLIREQTDEAELRWEAPSDGIVGYQLYRVDDTTLGILEEGDPVTGTSAFVTPGTEGLQRFWVVAIDAIGQLGEPSHPVWWGHDHEQFRDGDWHQ